MGPKRTEAGHGCQQCSNSMSISENRGTVLATPELVAQLRKHIEDDGILSTAREIGISRECLLRAVSGFGVRAGSLELIRQHVSDSDGR